MALNQMKYALLLIVALLAWSCGGGGTPSPLPGGAEHTQEITVSPTTDAAVTLESGAKASFPAGTFDVATTIIFSDTIVGPEREADTYPEGTTGLIGYMTINNPASEENQFKRDINVTFNIRVTGVADGLRYWVYRYNDETLKWERWGTTYATVTSDGTLATATLPTTGVFYYIGSVGLFSNLTVEGGGLPGGAAASLSGLVTCSSNGDPVAGIDVMLYAVTEGGTLPHDFMNGEADPNNANNHNLVYTDNDGRYEIQFSQADVDAGLVYLVRIGQRDAGYIDAESSTFTIDAGVNPDKNFVVTPEP
jgi:hypothetical protein